MKEGSDGSADDITHLSHDDYYKDIAHLPFEERAKTNFDHPNALDTELLIQHLKQLIEGETVIVPRYDFKRHCRFKDGEIDDEGRSSGRVVDSKKVVLVEGILILSVRELTNLMDLKVFVVRNVCMKELHMCNSSSAPLIHFCFCILNINIDNTTLT